MGLLRPKNKEGGGYNNSAQREFKDISKGIQFNQKVDYEKFSNLFHFGLYFDLKTTSHDHNQDDLTLDRLCYSYKQLQTLQ